MVHSNTAELFKCFKDHYNEAPPKPIPRDKSKDIRENLEKLIGTLDKTQLSKLNQIGSSSPRGGGETPYSPAGNDAPYERASKVVMKRVEDDNGFKKPPR